MKAAVYFGSRALYQDMIPASKSLIKNSDVDKVYLLTEDDVFPYELPYYVENINVSDMLPQWFTPNGPNWKTNWTHIGLARVAFTKIFPDMDRLLTIDCDTIVIKDVSDLWDLPIDDKYFAAVREPILSGHCGHLYVNAGVMMLNLDKIRADGKDDEMIRLLNEKALYFVAQDAMNACCKGGILEISGDYNKSPYTIQATDPRILHFAGSKNFAWRENPLYKQYADTPWSEIRDY